MKKICEEYFSCEMILSVDMIASWVVYEIFHLMHVVSIFGFG